MKKNKRIPEEDLIVRTMLAIGDGLNKATEICGDERNANRAAFAMLSTRIIEQIGIEGYKKLCNEALEN